MDAEELLHVGFVTGDRVSVLWGYDLAGDNDNFLKGLDPDYFEFVARDCAARLEDSSALSRRDRTRVATTLRLAYGQAVETLMALLCSAAQAPWCPMGWMARYKPRELCKVVGAIDKGERFRNVLVQQPVTWRSISRFVHQFIVAHDEALHRDVADKFAGLWKHVAFVFLADGDRGEYNALKHGLRVTPGGFAMSIGAEKTPGARADPQDTQSLGGSEFGSSFVVPTEVDGESKGQLRLSRVYRNWNHESLIVQLQLMACSMGNVISRLRICSGVDPSAVRFKWPGAAGEDPFALYGKLLHGPTGATFRDRVAANDIDPTKSAEVLAMYDRHSSG
jgi:hypothetical protein